MAKLNTMEKVVLEVLESSKSARQDDYVLMWLVCEKICPAVNEVRFAEAMFHHKKHKMPNWETVTRCRRKIQEKRPDLIENETKRLRKEEERVYREYAKS